MMAKETWCFKKKGDLTYTFQWIWFHNHKNDARVKKLLIFNFNREYRFDWAIEMKRKYFKDKIMTGDHGH